jgi:hypothetical protein
VSTARKVFDWHRQSGDELARELQDLPAGHYALVPVDELEDDEELVLPDAELVKLARAFEQADRSETIPAAEVYATIDAQLRATIAAMRDK